MRVNYSRIIVLLAWLAASLGEAASFQESFATDPLARGWRQFGKPSLFHWNATNQNLEVTWDSSETNSYFYRPLGTVLGKSDDFKLQFDLRLQTIQAGVTPDKPSTFEIAIGFFHQAFATHAAFNRGTGRASPNLVEFAYFPEADIIAATVSPTIVSSNNQFRPSFTFPLEMTTGDLFRISLSYTASNQTLVTTMIRNGTPFGPIKDVKLTASFSDFRVDTVSINSYSDHGDEFGSVFARGQVDNIELSLPPAPLEAVAGRFTNGLWQVEFASRTHWMYTLERSGNLLNWASASPVKAGTGGSLSLEENAAPSGETQFYRVRAERP